MTDSEGQAVDPQQEPALTWADIRELVRLLVDEVSKRIPQTDKSRDDPQEGPSTRPEEGHIILNRVILIFSPSPTHELYKIKTKGVETN